MSPFYTPRQLAFFQQTLSILQSIQAPQSLETKAAELLVIEPAPFIIDNSPLAIDNTDTLAQAIQTELNASPVIHTAPLVSNNTALLAVTTAPVAENLANKAHALAHAPMAAFYDDLVFKQTSAAFLQSLPWTGKTAPSKNTVINENIINSDTLLIPNSAQFFKNLPWQVQTKTPLSADNDLFTISQLATQTALHAAQTINKPPLTKPILAGEFFTALPW